MSVSKKMRFEIFKRDGFRCVYCGATPEASVLRVDHVEPVAKGGTDDPWNLVTACFDCNAGKSDRRLDKTSIPTHLDLELANEHIEQLRAYLAAQNERARLIEEAVNFVEQGWDFEFTASDRARIKTLLREFRADRLREALEIASARHPRSPYAAWLYFHGVLRNWRAGK